MHRVKRSGRRGGGGVTLKITCSWKVECALTSKLGSFFDFFFWRGKGRFRGQENWYSYRFIINWCSADLSFNFSSGLTGPISIRTFRICVWLFVLWYLYLFLKYCYSCYVQYKWVYTRSNVLVIRRSAFFYCHITTTDIRENEYPERVRPVCLLRASKLGDSVSVLGCSGRFCLPYDTNFHSRTGFVYSNEIFRMRYASRLIEIKPYTSGQVDRWY